MNKVFEFYGRDFNTACGAGIDFCYGVVSNGNFFRISFWMRWVFSFAMSSRASSSAVSILRGCAVCSY